MNALVLIDLQEGFNKKDVREVVPKVVELCEHIDRERWLVVAACFENRADSAFEHGLGWKTFKRVYDKQLIGKVEKVAKPVMVYNHSTYSVFNRRLVDYLRKEGVKTVALAGANTESFILHSAIDAFDLGFNVKVVGECSASLRGKNFHEWALEVLRGAIGRNSVVSSAEFFFIDIVNKR